MEPFVIAASVFTILSVIAHSTWRRRHVEKLEKGFDRCQQALREAIVMIEPSGGTTYRAPPTCRRCAGVKTIAYDDGGPGPCWLCCKPGEVRVVQSGEGVWNKAYTIKGRDLDDHIESLTLIPREPGEDDHEYALRALEQTSTRPPIKTKIYGL